jgi:hypothetical protein
MADSCEDSRKDDNLSTVGGIARARHAYLQQIFIWLFLGFLQNGMPLLKQWQSGLAQTLVLSTR